LKLGYNAEKQREPRQNRMNSTATDALSRFKALEERIARMLEALSTARNDKSVAERELAEARGQIRRLQNEMESMRGERQKIRKRVQRLISSIAELDSKKEEKIV
jgi:chromosome segregation ATPase